MILGDHGPAVRQQPHVALAGIDHRLHREGHALLELEAGARLERSSVRGPAIIGAGARLTDCYVGPYTAIGAGARIENAEIERSIVAAGATITHVGCRLSGSVIGRNVRVFRDFSLPRALRLQVGDGSEVALY